MLLGWRTSNISTAATWSKRNNKWSRIPSKFSLYHGDMKRSKECKGEVIQSPQGKIGEQEKKVELPTIIITSSFEQVTNVEYQEISLNIPSCWSTKCKLRWHPSHCSTNQRGSCINMSRCNALDSSCEGANSNTSTSTIYWSNILKRTCVQAL